MEIIFGSYPASKCTYTQLREHISGLVCILDPEIRNTGENTSPRPRYVNVTKGKKEKEKRWSSASSPPLLNADSQPQTLLHVGASFPFKTVCKESQIEQI